MPKIFIDTSAIYSLLTNTDQNHSQARRTWIELLRSIDEPITSNYVVTETVALVQNRFGLEAVRDFHQDILPLVSTHWVTPQEHAQAFHSLLTAQRRKLSFLDCVSFAVMRSLGISQAFHFDVHFREQGY